MGAKMARAPRGFSLASKSFVTRDFASAGVVVHVDAREFEAIGRALQRFNAKQQDRIMVSALNKGMDRLYTRVKRKLVDWSGIRNKARAYRDAKKQPASSGRWASAVIVAGRYTRVTAGNYAARWQRKWPGVKHRAWKRTQIADEAWLHRNVAFRRVGRSRYPIVPLFGPSMPREVERHEREAQALMTAVTQQYIAKEAQRQMARALARVKRK